MGPFARCCYAGTLARGQWLHFKVKIQPFRFHMGNRLVVPVRQRAICRPPRSGKGTGRSGSGIINTIGRPTCGGHEQTDGGEPWTLTAD